MIIGENFDDYLDFGEDDGLTITASPETARQMEVLAREDIEKRHAPDLAALPEEALDTGITRYGAYGNQTEINIRGFDTERIAILIDGVPANSPRSGEFDVNQIDLSNVERIEVIYGGSDTKYNVSGALGGVINIITIKKQEKGLRIDGSISNTGYLPGSYNRRRSGGDTGEAHRRISLTHRYCACPPRMERKPSPGRLPGSATGRPIITSIETTQALPGARKTTRSGTPAPVFPLPGTCRRMQVFLLPPICTMPIRIIR
jgi:hypothetical protein